MSKSLLIKNIGTLQTPVTGGAQGENVKLFQGAILIEDGVISEITSGGKLPRGAKDVQTVIDAEQRLVTPGLVDAHTHLVFGGYRQNEIPLKLAGAGYLDILRAGGGILDTVKKTREASFGSLYEKGKEFLDEMLALGITSCEAKSGYGLDFENEIKQLRVVGKLQEDHPMDVVSTFMGAHAVAPEYSEKPDEYIAMLCEKLIPYVAQNKLAKYCDIFCEEGVFDVKQSRKYLCCGLEHGLKLKIHTDEITAMGGTQLAAELNADSAEHLIAISQEGLEALTMADTIAVLLPGTSFYLGKPYAPARAMIERGIPVAIATDFNPGSCPSLNLQLAINLGYLQYKMTPEEILTAVTINAAGAIGLDDRLGTLETGKQADIVIWDAPDMEMLCYRFGSNLAFDVIKKGEII